ncbi:hypothetical protein [Gemmatimonas phototrophica]|uniref:Uncharacterized protein n=1 Tax=Gemmatimonas phototrophica TaxID=1379270 RepID=A0A143BGY7_9BACT|nr:hypothetical protein [Gemmatimonas phototrophica]AMW03762.1 hypothetical protein GEMMAAP_00695 [Gemmatimonas phototrophica]
MEQLAGFPCIAIATNKSGSPAGDAAVDAVVASLQPSGVSDVIVMVHGFRNSDAEARALYEQFLATFRVHLESGRFPQLAQRTIAVVSVFWPSKSFKEMPELTRSAEGGTLTVRDDAVEDAATAYALDALERFAEEQPDNAADVRAATAALMHTPHDPALQDELLSVLLARLGTSDDDVAEGLTALRSRAGHEVVASLAVPIILPLAHHGAEGGTAVLGSTGTSADARGEALFIGSLFRSIRGRVGQLLNMGTWYTMKQRAGDVGVHTVAPLVRAIARTPRVPRVHLVGHSLGGRVMASAAATLAGTPPVDSLLLLQAAFSHYGLAATVPGREGAGAFRAAVAPTRAVAGPFVATYSARDTVVGHVYAIASRLAGDNYRAIGDARDAYGGIGRNGAQQTNEARAIVLGDEMQHYALDYTGIVCVDGTPDDGITHHSDVTNRRVTNLFAQMMAAT